MTDEPRIAESERRTEVERRLDAVRELLERRGATACLLGSRADFAWVTLGGANHILLSSTEGVASVYIDRRRALVITTVIEADRIATEEVAGLGLDIQAVPWHEPGAMERTAERLAGGTVLGESDLEADIAPLRMVLGPLEQERLRWLGARCTSALGEALDGVTAGVREDDASSSLVARLARDSIRAPVVLAAADERIERYRHPLPAARPVEARLMLVAVAERWGLHVAATRFRELREPDASLARKWAAVREVQERVHGASRPGATLGAVFAEGVAAYEAVGFPDEWRAHHQGGPIGYLARERICVPGDPQVIAAGMALAWNPSIVGVKAEETILVTDGGAAEVVTRP